MGSRGMFARMFEERSVKKSKPHRVRTAVGRAVLKLFGWKSEGSVPPVAKAVIIAAPHTSNWDLPFTLAIAYDLGVELNWVAKKELFKQPFKGFFHWLGGIPVDRSKKEGFTSAVAGMLRKSDNLYLVIAPEGTRAKVARWKTGFYHIAVEANVPIVLGYLDYEKKTGGMGHLFYPTGDLEKDFAQIREFYSDKRGKNTADFGPVTLMADAKDAEQMKKRAGEKAVAAATAKASIADANSVN
jgi:1-acyl-sn-glycerol-3-phosphate acyltransferase